MQGYAFMNNASVLVWNLLEADSGSRIRRQIIWQCRTGNWNVRQRSEELWEKVHYQGSYHFGRLEFNPSRNSGRQRRACWGSGIFIRNTHQPLVKSNPQVRWTPGTSGQRQSQLWQPEIALERVDVGPHMQKSDRWVLTWSSWGDMGSPPTASAQTSY